MQDAHDMVTVTTTERLRLLLRLHRQREGMSQKQAADRARISTIWWRHIEAGHRTSVPSTTLGRMAWAVGLSALTLQRMGQDNTATVAAGLESDERLSRQDPEEDWISQGPFDEGTKRSLIVHLRQLKAAGEDPLSRHWPPRGGGRPGRPWSRTPSSKQQVT